MKISKRAGPARCIKLQHRASRLRDESAAAHVGAGFAIGEMQNRLVNAPLFRRRLVQTNLFWEMPPRTGEQCRRTAERFQFVTSLLACHLALLLFHLDVGTCRLAAKPSLNKRRKGVNCFHTFKIPCKSRNSSVRTRELFVRAWDGNWRVAVSYNARF